MRVRMQMRADGSGQAGMGMSEPPRLAMGDLAEALVSAGILVVKEGAHVASTGMRVHFTRGRRMVTDGPFVETKELMGD